MPSKAKQPSLTPKRVIASLPRSTRSPYKMPPRPRIINRVHAPENDMQSTLPLRQKLLKHLRTPTTTAPKRPRFHPTTELKLIIRTLPSNSPQLATLLTAQAPLETRILTLEALHHHPLHHVLPPLSNVLPTLPDEHLAPILDRVIRIQTTIDPLSAARTERLARGLGLKISRGAYIKLVLSSTPQQALLHAHSCLAVGHSFNTAFLNALLKTGLSPDRILAEFRRRGLQPNGNTADTILNTIGITDAILPDTWARIAGTVIGFVARDDARKAVGLLDVAQSRGVRVEPSVYDTVCVACVNQNAWEAALRVWREKRRSWMGGLGKRARFEVVSTGLIRVGDPRWGLLVEGLAEGERELLGRLAARSVSG